MKAKWDSDTSPREKGYGDKLITSHRHNHFAVCIVYDIKNRPSDSNSTSFQLAYLSNHANEPACLTPLQGRHFHDNRVIELSAELRGNQTQVDKTSNNVLRDAFPTFTDLRLFSPANELIVNRKSPILSISLITSELFS
jgi:hypothetical protein